MRTINSITLGPGCGATVMNVGQNCDEITIEHGVAYIRHGTKVDAYNNWLNGRGVKLPDEEEKEELEEKTPDQSEKPKEPKPASKR